MKKRPEIAHLKNRNNVRFKTLLNKKYNYHDQCIDLSKAEQVEKEDSREQKGEEGVQEREEEQGGRRRR